MSFDLVVVTRAAQMTAAMAATESHAPTDDTAQGSTSSTTRTASAIVPRGATTRCRSRATASTASIAAARVAGAGKPSSHTYANTTPTPRTRRDVRGRRSNLSSNATHAAKNPTWNPLIERRCASPDATYRSRTAASSSARRPVTSASTSGARAPNNSAARAEIRSRSAPRPRGTASSNRTRRNARMPRSAEPSHRPATTQVVPPCASGPSGQRSRTAPRHGPAIAVASTTPPLTGAGSSRRTMTARTPPSSPIPPQLAARCRSATSPHRSPTSVAIPMAAATGARRARASTPTATGSPSAHAPTSPNRRTPAARPTPNATVIQRIGGRMGRRQAGLTA